MTGRRALSDLLIDVADGVLGFTAPPGIRPTSMVVMLPVEIEMARTPEGPEFRAELPRFVTRTSFDPTPGRLTVHWAEEATP
jgi:hypothetical protein